MTAPFEKLLAAMGMTLDEATCPGLVRADNKTLEKKRLAAPLEEIVALERAIHFNATYVYFRRPNGRAPTPVAYLYDWTARLSQEQKAVSTSAPAPPKQLNQDLLSLHQGVWSAGEIPLVCVFTPTQVQVYHVLRGPNATERGVEADPWETIEVAGKLAKALERLKAYSAYQLDNGTFWESHVDPSLKLEGAAFMALSQEIESCRAKLTAGQPEAYGSLVKRLLILFVMIKYLEERKDHQGQGVFPEGTFSKFAKNAAGFVDLLRAGGGAVLKFLDHLAHKDRFNGDVFQLNEEERKSLLKFELEPIADLLDAKIENGQYTLWRRYAFHELPVELISHLYEQFLPKQPGVVYTPPVLVNFILDEVLPLSEQTPESFRLLDLSCGSGVFLVGAFKRLVHRWRRDNQFQSPDVATLKSLLRKHIFGVDIEGEAVRLTMFSLAVAVCDSLEPRVIWDGLHFDRLKNTNVFEADFFEKVKLWEGSKGFDLIVGNPPFKSELSKAAQSEVAEITKREPDFNLPDHQVALLFLKSAIRIAKPDGQIALVQPASALLYNQGSNGFREPLLKQIHVSQIVDFTHLSRVLFKRPRKKSLGRKENVGAANPADFPVAVVFAQNRPPDDGPLLHVTVRRTVQAEQKLMLEVDHYDLHFVPREQAISNPRIWKANFIGGGRIPRFLERLGRLRTLGEFLEKAKRERGWDSGEGYIVGSGEQIRRLKELLEKEKTSPLSADEASELTKLRKKYTEAPWLTGHLMVPAEAFTATGIRRNGLEKIEERFFERPRSESLFQGPLLLVKEVAEAESKKVPIELVTDVAGMRFGHRIYGIHAPSTDLEDLRRIQNTIGDDRLVTFLLMAQSPEYLVDKSSAIRAGDLLNLPFAESPEDFRLSTMEHAIMDDALAHVADFKRKGEHASVQKPPEDNHLQEFREFFLSVLGSVYPSLKAGTPLRLPGAVCYPFYFGDKPSLTFKPGTFAVSNVLHLLTTVVGASLRCQRVLRIFHGNMLLLIKPAQLRYWLRSIAIRDADELFVELRGLGY